MSKERGKQVINLPDPFTDEELEMSLRALMQEDVRNAKLPNHVREAILEYARANPQPRPRRAR